MFSAGKCPFMHNATAEVTKLKAGEFVACACDYQEGACKKETTVDSGNYRWMTLLVKSSDHFYLKPLHPLTICYYMARLVQRANN